MAKMYRVYSIIERPKQDDYWLNIGVAFPHEGGPEAGLNVILQALPLPNGQGQCKVVLRPYDPEKAKAEDEQEQAAVKKKERATA
ncbi:MAG: hypothetical protein ABUL43_03360 [Hyphomicrobium sp.]